MTADGGDHNTNMRGLLVAIAIVILLLAGAMVLVRQLTASARMQDCLASGRTNCAPIKPATH